MTLSSYSDWQLVSLSPWPRWGLLLVLAAIVFAALLPAADLIRGASEKKRTGLFALALLRVLACALAAFLVLQPGIQTAKERREKPRAAVLLDTSESMSLPDAGGKSRGKAALELLEKHQDVWRALAQKYRLEFWGFDSAPVPWGADFLRAGTAFEGRSTDILGALSGALHLARGGGTSPQAASDASRHLSLGAQFAGALIVSDGVPSNAERSLSKEGRQALEALQAPVSTVLVGEGNLKDIAVLDVLSDSFAFIRSPATVTARLRVRGFSGRKIPVTLKMDGQPISTREVRIPLESNPGSADEKALDAGEVRVSFDFTPEKTGDFACAVEVPLQPGEALSANNVRPFTLKVIRDRIRVLHVSGRPTWDLRFLRSRLKGDPNIDLVSSFILRDASDDTGASSDSELALIPFPIQEVFHDQLQTFDVIVLQNFSPEERSYSLHRYLPGIVQYILSGGAMVVIGGENGWSAGRSYADTQLAELLPVIPTGRPPIEAPFRARLTEAGLTHPAAQVSPVSSEVQSAWNHLPPMDGLLVTKIRPDASVLLDHPFEVIDGQNLPVVAVRTAGEGRVMAILSDSTWQWAFDGSDGSPGSRTYDRFWASALRWLVRDAEASPVKMSVSSSAPESGEPLRVRVEVKGADYAPKAGAKVLLALMSASPETASAIQTAGKDLTAIRGALGTAAIRMEEGTSDADGIANLELPAPEGGAWRLQAFALEPDTGALLGTDSRALAVQSSRAELFALDPGKKLMREMALVTGGRAFDSPESFDGDFPLKTEERVEFDQSQTAPLGYQEWVFLLMALCLAVQWFFARRLSLSA